MKRWVVALLVCVGIIAGAAASAPYDYRGDVLGMALADFKRKHARAVVGDPRKAPFCSDDHGPKGGPLREHWHEDAGIVTCSKELPFEHRRRVLKDTLGGSPVTPVFYFLDGSLYQISATFPAKRFVDVVESATEKFGAPRQPLKHVAGPGAAFQNRRVAWESGGSRLEVIEREIDVDTGWMVMKDVATALRAAARHRPKPSDF